MSQSSRVLYLSIWSNKHNNTPYHYLLENDANMKQCLEFIKENKFDTVVLYNLTQMSYSPKADSLHVRLDNAINELRCNGVQTIGFAVGGAKCIRCLKAFCNKYNIVPDIVVTEYEFWNGGNYSFTEYISLLKQLQDFTFNISEPIQTKICTYIGNVRKHSEEPSKLIQDIAEYVDSFYIEAYAADPKGMVKKIQNRIKDFPKDVGIYAICSLEGKGLSAGAEHFLGDYLQSKSFTLDKLENEIMISLQPNSNVHGIVYYNYAYAHYHTSKNS